MAVDRHYDDFASAAAVVVVVVVVVAVENNSHAFAADNFDLHLHLHFVAVLVVDYYYRKDTIFEHSNYLTAEHYSVQQHYTFALVLLVLVLVLVLVVVVGTDDDDSGVDTPVVVVVVALAAAFAAADICVRVHSNWYFLCNNDLFVLVAAAVLDIVDAAAGDYYCIAALLLLHCDCTVGRQQTLLMSQYY